MANTRDTIGENKTLAGMVGNTLTELEEDSAVTLGNYALAGNNALTEVRMSGTQTIGQYAFQNCTGLTELGENAFPNATTIQSYAFSGCSNIASARFPKATSIQGNAFQNCSKLAHLILAGSAKTNGSSNVLAGTPIAIGNGGVYVPADLVDTYKADTYWGAYNIYPIGEYPKSSFDTISDSWDTIIGYANAGTIGQHYQAGDTKKITIDGVDYYAVLAAISQDPLSSNPSATANSSWLLKTLLSQANGSGNNQQMNSSGTTVGGWGTCKLRTYLSETILPKMPENIQNAIKTVNKPYFRFEDTSVQIAEDKLWIPSMGELKYSGTNAQYVAATEANSVDYTGAFGGKTLTSSGQTQFMRTYNNGSAYYWWLRSAYSATNFCMVNSGGGAYSDGANYTYGVLLGFCI